MLYTIDRAFGDSGTLAKVQQHASKINWLRPSLRNAPVDFGTATPIDTSHAAYSAAAAFHKSSLTITFLKAVARLACGPIVASHFPFTIFKIAALLCTQREFVREGWPCKIRFERFLDRVAVASRVLFACGLFACALFACGCVSQ